VRRKAGRNVCHYNYGVTRSRGMVAKEGAEIGGPEPDGPSRPLLRAPPPAADRTEQADRKIPLWMVLGERKPRNSGGAQRTPAPRVTVRRPRTLRRAPPNGLLHDCPSPSDPRPARSPSRAL
jgi:hypothetical protein